MRFWPRPVSSYCCRTEEELRILRDEIDPTSMRLREFPQR
jgi:hypothetical protein